MVVAARPTTVAQPSLERCIERLADAVAAARTLGMSTDAADQALELTRRRLGYPGDTYVLALVGGTGVGKSSLLNQLAGSPISPVSAERPTTADPLAWIPATGRTELAPLLDWLGVERVHEHVGAPGAVAVLDLPDLDSIVAEHREKVEEILPKVDAVAWITDPEKYADAVLHDEFLVHWLPSLDRQVLVVNKSDRLTAGAASELQHDLERLLRTRTGTMPLPILMTSAVAVGGIEPLATWLAQEVDAKRVVRRRAAATVVVAAADLAAAAGSDDVGPRPLISDAGREEALLATSENMLRLIDIPQLERRATEAVRARARARAGGLFGFVRTVFNQLTGRPRRSADPRTFLVRWRERGSLSAATSGLSEALTGAVRAAPISIRPAVAELAERRPGERAAAEAVDHAVAATPDVPPTSRWWSLLGPIQSVVGLGILLAAIWIVVAALLRVEVDVVEIPVLGHVPIPLVILVSLVAVSVVLARLTDLHARLIGRRWARSLASEVERRVSDELRASAFSALDEVEASRVALWQIAEEIRADCGGTGEQALAG
jgi:hypothetical protein